MTNTVTVVEIARYLGVTRKTVSETIVKKPAFPAPVLQASRRTRAWDADAVRSYFGDKHRGGALSVASTDKKLADAGITASDARDIKRALLGAVASTTDFEAKARGLIAAFAILDRAVKPGSPSGRNP